ncbi:MAG: 4-alpha-glucanotransferase [Acidobacteriota bacterium]|nr:4-alpha-glucanotransferase [Acidobacteriota bacterium]
MRCHPASKPLQERASGVLLHPTSLPGPWGIGDLGSSALQFLDWLASAGQSVWQILPLGPPAGGDSPYGATSSFAGNPLLISPGSLIDQGLLPKTAVDGAAPGAGSPIDFTRVPAAKDALLRRSWAHVEETGSLRAELEAFETGAENRTWLGDWSLYAALKHENRQRPWTDWPADLRERKKDALEAARERLRKEIRFQTYLQFLFSRQWASLHDHAHNLGIRILGDLPIYPAADSAEVWAHQELFELDDTGHPTAVAGVPPDAFTADGQFWGNPLYRWETSREECFSWWIDRLEWSLRQVDLLRLDHFRGFAAYWRIPATAKTAREGAWVEGPGADLFLAIEDKLGKLPLISEDLGVITPDVVELRERFGLPGMKVLQFASEDPDSDHLPRHHTRSSVVYTGTHDNDTTRGWFEALDRKKRLQVLDVFDAQEKNVPWAMTRAAFGSIARLAIVPAQDLLGLGSEARMNTPGIADGNWSWRLEEGQLDATLARRLRRLSRNTDRLLREP